MHEIQCRITGRVQMVMYRDFVCRNARLMNIVGTVQNKEDGSVAVIAQGNKEKLETFVDILKKGSVLSRIDSIDVKWQNPKNEFKNFSIVY